MDSDCPASLSTYADLLLQALRANRRLQDDLEDLRLELQLVQEQSAGRLEALQVALAMVTEGGKSTERAKATSQALRDELRRYIAAQMTPSDAARAA